MSRRKKSFIDELVGVPAKWISGTGPDASVVHSTRIRLARNVRGLPFPHRSDAGTLEQMKDRARDLAEKVLLLRGINVIDVDTLGPLDREFLVERHLISREFAVGHGKLLLVDGKEHIAIMVNEEDHFRFQSMRSGLDVFEAWNVMKAIEREADAHVEFSFRPPYGYLTACPTNLGTGMRVSALCHLPALSVTGHMQEVFTTANHVGIAVRGFYGEGSNAIGNFFQFSNRATLGQSEEEILTDLENWVAKIRDRELAERKELVKKDLVALTDQIHRAQAILSSARLLTSNEMMTLLSWLRLGLDLAIISSPPIGTINLIQLSAQAAHLQKRTGKNLTPRERDEARAEYVREIMEE